MGYNQEHGEPFDPAEAIRVDEAERPEAERVYWAGRVRQLEAEQAGKQEELQRIAAELAEARDRSAAAGEPRRRP